MKIKTKLLVSLVLFWPTTALAQNSNSEVSPSDTHSLSNPSSYVNESENEMHLVCTGSTLTSTPSGQTSAIVSDSNGNFAVGTSTSNDIKKDVIQVRLRVIGANADFFVPAGFNNAGWRKVKDLKIGNDEISGKITYWLNKSTFQIDRRTGIITTSNGFEGICKKEDLQKRAF